MARTATPLRLAEIAAKLGCEVVSGGDTLVTGVAALADAGPGDLSFVRSRQYAAALGDSAAGAVIAPDGLETGSRPTIRSLDPSLDFARAVSLIVESPRPLPGIHPSAVVDPDAVVDPSAALGPGVVVGAGAQVGPRSVLHANVCLYSGAVVGADCELHSGVILREDSELGERVRLQPGVLIGGDGFGFLPTGEGQTVRVPQVGRVVIEDDVEIGAGTTVDRATLGETRIRRGAKIDNLVMIGHNCDIGENAIIVAQSGLGGNTRVGTRAILMARVGSAGQLEIGDGAFVGARSGLHHDVAPHSRVYGSPAVEERVWHRQLAALKHLPQALRRLRVLERQLGLRGEGEDSADTADDTVGGEK